MPQVAPFGALLNMVVDRAELQTWQALVGLTCPFW
jgi:hypothetical protein